MTWTDFATPANGRGMGSKKNWIQHPYSMSPVKFWFSGHVLTLWQKGIISARCERFFTYLLDYNRMCCHLKFSYRVSIRRMSIDWKQTFSCPCLFQTLSNLTSSAVRHMFEGQGQNRQAAEWFLTCHKCIVNPPDLCIQVP